MKIILISDTHGSHEDIKVPDGDMLIHCGDFTACNSLVELPRFNRWLGELPHKYKIFVAGNHDWVFDTHPDLARQELSNAIWLHNKEITIEGFRIYGTSIQPEFCNWAFNANTYRRKHYYDMIPEGLDILITHCPPYGILDYIPDQKVNVGCPLLLQSIARAKPRINCFGHIHASYDEHYPPQFGTKFINCAVLNEQYKVQNEPITIEI